MRITRNAGKLRAGRKHNEDINPMDGMANLVDVMLVFACGLIIALIAAWNVDVTKTPYKVDSIKQQQSQTEMDKKDLKEMGKVYKDPNTGKMYVIEDE